MTAIDDRQHIHFTDRTVPEHFKRARQRVRRHLSGLPNGRYATAFFWWKLAILGGLALATYLALVLGGPWSGPAATGLGLVTAVSGFLAGLNVAHDGVHHAISRRGWVNTILAEAAFTAMGVDRSLWASRHTESHHLFPNVVGCDIDIDENSMMRLSPHHKWRPMHRFQHLYAVATYAAVHLYQATIGDVIYLFKKRLANIRRPRPGVWEVARFCARKAVFAGLVATPIVVNGYPLLPALAVFAGLSAAMTLIFVFVLITTHFGVEQDHPTLAKDGSLPGDWMRHAARTSLDWSPGSVIANVVSGGANAHLAHHLFAGVCNAHLPAISEILAEEMTRAGVRHNVTGFGAMIASHFRLLWRLGRRPGPMAASGASIPARVHT